MEPPPKKTAEEMAAFASWWPDPDRPEDPESPTTLEKPNTARLFVLFSLMYGYFKAELTRCGTPKDAPSPAP